MLTIKVKKALTVDDELEPKYYIEGSCLSTDTKPTTGIGNGSILFEMNTGTMYKFDEENAAWRAW